MGRRYPAQIVAMCKEDMRDWVAEQASKDEETIAGELRRIVRENRRMREVAERSGMTAEDLLSHLERQASAAASAADD
jgi:DNA-binding phage protein